MHQICFVHFFAVVARQRREQVSTKDDDFLILFVNLDAVL